MLTAFSLTAFSAYLVLAPPPPILNFFQMVSLHMDYRGAIIGGAAVYFACAMAGEKWVFPMAAKWVKQVSKWRKRKNIEKRGGAMERKVYKTVLRELR